MQKTDTLLPRNLLLLRRDRVLPVQEAAHPDRAARVPEITTAVQEETVLPIPILILPEVLRDLPETPIPAEAEPTPPLPAMGEIKQRQLKQEIIQQYFRSSCFA